MIEFKVESIDALKCKEWLLYKHYAKRVPSIQYSFGLYDAKILIGVCTFGSPPRSMNDGEFVFKEYRVKTLELNRLCVNDGLPKNTLSFFVSKCLKQLPTPICIVSYADHTFGHQGYIYQATNWIYTGLNTVHTKEVTLNGKNIHTRTLTGMGYTNMTDLAASEKGIELGEYSKKHRYFMFLGNKREIKLMRKSLIYPILPYPKGDNKKYDSSYNPSQQPSLF